MSVEFQILDACHMSTPQKIKGRQKMCHIHYFQPSTSLQQHHSRQIICSNVHANGAFLNLRHTSLKNNPTHPQCSTALRNPYQMRGTPHGIDKCQTIPQGTLITNMVSHTEVAGECPDQVFCTAKWQHSFQQRTILGCCILKNSECSFPQNAVGPGHARFSMGHNWFGANPSLEQSMTYCRIITASVTHSSNVWILKPQTSKIHYNISYTKIYPICFYLPRCPLQQIYMVRGT